MATTVEARINLLEQKSRLVWRIKGRLLKNWFMYECERVISRDDVGLRFE